jgi:hypothetical protein
VFHKPERVREVFDSVKEGFEGSRVLEIKLLVQIYIVLAE